MNVTDQLADLTVARQMLLLRVQSSETRKIDRLFADIANGIEAQLKRAKPLTEYQGRRLNAQIRQLTDLIAIAPPDLSELATIEAKAAVDNLAQVGVDATLPTLATLQQISNNVIIQGAVIDEWFKQIDQNTKFEISRAVKTGVAQGLTNQQIAKSIVGIKTQGDKGAEVLKVARRHATTITRTAVQTIANDSAFATYQANDDVIKGVEHVSTLDSRTTIICAARDGAAWDLNGKQFKGNPAPFAKPPLHFNCLPEDSLISACGTITGVSKRWVDAKLIVINTAFGNKVRCTPNHPILTDRGWVPAQFVNTSDKVVCGAGIKREGLVNWDNDNVVPTIKQISDSFVKSSNVSTVPVPMTAKDFHNDGIDSDVAIISSNRFLRSDLEASVNQRLADNAFINGSHSALSNLGCSGSFAPFFKGCSSSTCGNVCIFNKFKSFFVRCARHATKLLLRPVAWFKSVTFNNIFNCGNRYCKVFGNTCNSDAFIKHPYNIDVTNIGFEQFPSNIGIDFIQQNNSIFGENSSDNFMSDSELAANIFNGKYGEVTFNNVISVNSIDFSGHVYNLETVEGFYCTDGIVTHNCRSVLVPVTKTFKELGIDRDEIPEGTRSTQYGAVRQSMKFEDFMNRQPKSFIEDVLGVGRYEIYKENKLTLNQLLDTRALKPLTLAELKEKYGNNAQ